MLSALAALIFVATSPAKSTYVDPERAFAIDMPAGWQAVKTNIDATMNITRILQDPTVELAPQVSVIVQSFSEEIPEGKSAEFNGVLSTFVLDTMKSQGAVGKETKSDTTFGGKKALRLDLEYTDENQVSWTGYSISVCGKTHAFAILVYAKTDDAKMFKVVDDAAKTVNLESTVPRPSFITRPSPLLSNDSLREVSGRVKSGLERDAMDHVLVAGTPPLTYASVAKFATALELLFDMPLTESEFQAFQQGVIENYSNGDTSRKASLARQGESLLTSVTDGSPALIEQNKSDGRKAFTEAFQQGAQMGLGYAKVMSDAISRHATALRQVEGTAPKQGWDASISDGDLDATMEMLYFMWVASGRNANISADRVATLRTKIIAEISSAPVKLQFVVANGREVYAGFRQQWQVASDSQRLELARGFGDALDSLGLTADGSFVQTGDSRANGYGSALTKLAMNSAWNPLRTWTPVSRG